MERSLVSIGNPVFKPSFFKTKSNPKSLLFRLNCHENSKDYSQREEEEEWVTSSSASPYKILGVDPTSHFSSAQLKAAFRARAKKYHPDVYKSSKDADVLMRRVIRAYQVLLESAKDQYAEDSERDLLDFFDEPECEAYDLFINELLCIGKVCEYSCVNRAPHAFSFTSENGTARAISQGHQEDYQVQLAVGQCPRKCIHYVTPCQRTVLENLLNNILNDPYNMGDASLLESLISKAKLQNNRYEEPKRKPDVSTEYVDWC